MISYTTNAGQCRSSAGEPRELSVAQRSHGSAKETRIGAGRDAVLFHQGDKANAYFRVISGAVRLCRVMADGRRYVVDFMLPGDLVGLDAGETYAFTGEAIVETVVLRYDRPLERNRIENDLYAGRRLLDLTIQNLAAAHDQLLMLGRMTALERVASFLMHLQRRLIAAKASTGIIHLAMTRADIADHLGLTLETVSRMLNELKRRQIIALPHPQEVHIRNQAALDQLGIDTRH